MVFVTEPWAWCLWLVLAACSTLFTLLQTEIALSFPARLSGRAYTGTNLLLFGGAFILQSGFGGVVDLASLWATDTVQAFQAAMLVYMLLQIISLSQLRRAEQLRDSQN